MVTTAKKNMFHTCGHNVTHPTHSTDSAPQRPQLDQARTNKGVPKFSIHPILLEVVASAKSKSLSKSMSAQDTNPASAVFLISTVVQLGNRAAQSTQAAQQRQHEYPRHKSEVRMETYGKVVFTARAAASALTSDIQLMPAEVSSTKSAQQPHQNTTSQIRLWELVCLRNGTRSIKTRY